MQTITIDGVQIPTDKLIAAGWKAPEEKKSVVWKPEIGEEIYHLDFVCGVTIRRMTYHDTKNQRELHEIGNSYRTYDDALHAIEVQKATVRVNRRIEELNDGWVPDWKNVNQDKFYIHFDISEDEFLWMQRSMFKLDSRLNSIMSIDIAETIIEEMHNDLCVIWGISNEKK